MRAHALVVLALSLLVTAGTASAEPTEPAEQGAPTLHFLGGTPAHRDAVRAALAQSAFPWELLDAPVAVEIGPNEETSSRPGRVSLNARLLDSGRFAWGVIQHEFAHQVDYRRLSSESRAALAAALGAATWWGTSGTPHAARGAERFASTLAWSYWPSRENAMAPESASRADESGALRPAEFRALLASLLGVPDTLSEGHSPGTRTLSRRSGAIE